MADCWYRETPVNRLPINRLPISKNHINRFQQILIFEQFGYLSIGYLFLKITLTGSSKFYFLSNSGKLGNAVKVRFFFNKMLKIRRENEALLKHLFVLN